MPFGRLRASIPDEFFETDFGAALGRKHGFSAAGMGAAKELRRSLLKKKNKEMRHSLQQRRSSVASAAPASSRQSSSGVVDPDLHAEQDPPHGGGGGRDDDDQDLVMTQGARLEEFLGTALVLAFLQVTQLMPVTEIARHRGAAAMHFQELTTPAGWSFEDMTIKMLTMLSPGMLSEQNRWWLKVRLRFVALTVRVVARSQQLVGMHPTYHAQTITTNTSHHHH
jgi:hypothetical protein